MVKSIIRSREQKKQFWEQGAEEIIQRATQTLWREQGDCKINLGSSKKKKLGIREMRGKCKGSREPGTLSLMQSRSNHIGNEFT